MDNKLAIQSFEPGVYIEIDDTFTGTRKLARVEGAGTSYVDLQDDPTGFPIYAQLKPAEAGNILGWGLYLTDRFPDEHAAFAALVDRLIASGHDVLTYNRAAHWAFQQHVYDYERALNAGLAATERVREGRARMDAIIATIQGAAP